MSLDDQEDLEALEHVVGVCVGTHADCDALCHHLEHRCASYCVAHVGLRVVDYHCAGLLDDVHLGRAHMDAVSEQSLISEQSVVEQSVDRSAAVVAEAVINVIHALGDVDVESCHAVVGLYHLLECLVRNGEESMSAEHGFDHVIILFDRPLSEVDVLLDALSCLLFSVSLGYFVAEAGSHAELLCDILDREERSRNLAEACVMVENSRNTISDAIKDRCVSTCLGAVNRQMSVYIPPCTVKHLKEVCRVVAFDRESSGKA